MAKTHQKFIRTVNQAKLRSYRRSPKYKFGYRVPNDYNEAVEFDHKNGNNKWKEAIKLELDSLNVYNVFKDLGYKAPVPDGYKRIRVHLVFDVKNDGRHKARLVADGHLTDLPLESVYSGVVSLRGIRIIIFLAELNGLQTWTTDVSSAYLEAKTAEKIVIFAGPEFGDLENHTLMIYKALYGLRTSGLRWHERFADCMKDINFLQCKAEPDIWLRLNEEENIYEYVAVYVDDLCIVAKIPQQFVDSLMIKYSFKFKGTGPIKFYLGCDYFRDDKGHLCYAPKRYVERMAQTYQRLFGKNPRTTYQSPLDRGDHPELDTSEFLNSEDMQKYQSLVGAMQWAVTLGHIDITTAVITLSGFRVAPRHSHLDRVKRIYGYLLKFKNAAIHINTEEPD